jgi:hypothetical protein
LLCTHRTVTHPRHQTNPNYPFFYPISIIYKIVWLTRQKGVFLSLLHIAWDMLTGVKLIVTLQICVHFLLSSILDLEWKRGGLREAEIWPGESHGLGVTNVNRSTWVLFWCRCETRSIF